MDLRALEAQHRLGNTQACSNTLLWYSHISSKQLKLKFLSDLLLPARSTMNGSRLVHLISSNEIAMQGGRRRLNCTLDAPVYLNLFTSSRCCRPHGRERNSRWHLWPWWERRINVSKRRRSHALGVIPLKVICDYSRYVLYRVSSRSRNCASWTLVLVCVLGSLLFEASPSEFIVNVRIYIRKINVSCMRRASFQY